MEARDSYQPARQNGRTETFCARDSGKCLHYYFYYMDTEFGLVYL